MFRHPIFSEVEYACGGLWVTEIFAITTAHCLTYHDIKLVGHLGKDNDWHAIIDDPKTYGFPAKQYFVFDNYSEEGDSYYENDIGLVKVHVYERFPLINLPDVLYQWTDWRYIQSRPVLMHGLGKTENDEYASYLKYMKGKLHLQDVYSAKNCNLAAVKMGMALCIVGNSYGDRSNIILTNVSYYTKWINDIINEESFI